MNFLYIGGPSRSGTTAFTRYLNEHPEVMICRERYKWGPRERVTPAAFSFDKILDFDDGYEIRDTERRKRVHSELIASKDPHRLKWIGDKHPGYVKTLDLLATNNPGASFIIMYRPVEEVAESFESRSKNPNDAWLGGKEGFRMGVEHWNAAIQSTRKFIESGVNLNVLILVYEDFFARNEECLPLISRFLNLDFDESVREKWREESASFESGRRNKDALSEEKRAFIKENADRETEMWILGRIRRQWEEFNAHPPDLDRVLIEERRRSAVLIARKQTEAKHQVKILRHDLAKLEGEHQVVREKCKSLEAKNRRLAKRTESLERQLENIKSSRSWRILSGVNGIRARLPRKS